MATHVLWGPLLRNVVGVGGGGGDSFPAKKSYEGVSFNVISVTRVGGGQIHRKMHYVTLEWPLARYLPLCCFSTILHLL